ncbi:MAG TPA: hypothetical protein VLC12_12770, partial [Terriglobales bacterium]|nr:hypothetical protein [Terriglobales bacterium]
MKTAKFVVLFAALAAASLHLQAQSLDEQATQILTALVKINTSNPPGNEVKAAQYIKSLLDAEGIP